MLHWHQEGDKGKGQKLGAVTIFKYLGTDFRMIAENRSLNCACLLWAFVKLCMCFYLVLRMGVGCDFINSWSLLFYLHHKTPQLPPWRYNNIFLGSWLKQMRCLVISIYLYPMNWQSYQQSYRKTGFRLPKVTEHFIMQIQECPTLEVKSFLWDFTLMQKDTVGKDCRALLLTVCAIIFYRFNPYSKCSRDGLLMIDISENAVWNQRYSQ